MKFLRSDKIKMTKDDNCENVPYLEITKVVLMHYNVVNNSYQWSSRVLYALTPNQSFGHLLDSSPKHLLFLKTFDSEFSYIEIWFTDQNSRSIEVRPI